jgi:hypothetical protein
MSMGTRSKIKRVHLKINDDPESCFLGIVSAEPDYKLSLTLNKKLNIALKSVSPVVIETESDKKLTFSRFSDTSASPHLIYDLVSNRSDKHFLFKKLKNIDYILQIHDPQNEIDTDHITTILRDTEYISAVFNLDTDMMKNNNLNHLLIH